MITIPYIVLIWAVSLSVCFAVVICTICIAINLSRHILPSNRIIVGDINEEYSEEKKWDARFLDRWIRYSSSDRYLISNYRFIEDLNLSAYLFLSRVNKESVVEDLDLEVHGVSVSRLVNFIYHLSKGPYRGITGNFAQQGNKMVLTLSFNQRDHVLKTWQFEIRCDPNGLDREERIYDLIDEGIFALVHHVGLSAKMQKKGKQMNSSNIQLNPKALAAYHKGRHHLDQYFKTHSEDELELAQKQFQNLTYEVPGYADGFLLLGLALSEDRKEENAIELFQRAKGLSSDTLEKLQIGLMIAKSRLKFYTWASCVQTISELDSLITNLLSKEPKKEGWNTEEYDILLARAHAEKAHCYGHLLVFLKSKTYTEALENLKQLSDFKNLVEEKSPKDSCTSLVQPIYEALLSGIEEAQAKTLPPENQLSEGVKARISEVKGYACFRRAQWISPDSDNEYEKECMQAISELEQAEIINPMNYALLQNMGMIYLTRRYDPDGKYIRTAERYYERSHRLKPKDYYAYQQLALCILRRISSVENIESRSEEIKRGLELVNKAIGFRPESNSLQILRVQFLLLCWLNEEDANRTNIEKEIETAFHMLARKQYTEGQQKWSLGWAKVFWLANKLKYSDAGNFDSLLQDLKKSLDSVINMTDLARSEHWVASEIYSAARTLSTEIDQIKVDNRHDLRVSIAASLE